jgi:hypothetical protein
MLKKDISSARLPGHPCSRICPSSSAPYVLPFPFYPSGPGLFDTRRALRYKPIAAVISLRTASGAVVKLVITPACHAGGHGFKSRPPR